MLDRPAWLIVAAVLLLSSLLAFALPEPEATAAGESARSQASAVPEAAWRRDAIWDDGRAEFAVYDWSWVRYGARRQGSALLVLTKEPWRQDRELKADDPQQSDFEVIKLNHIRSARTGIYRYEQMASVFRRREDGGLQKIAASSAEACGLTTSRMTKGKLAIESYFDSEGSRQHDWPDGALLEDGLPMSLRDYLVGDIPAKISVFPSLLHGRHPSLEVEDWTLRRSEDKDGNTRFELRAGSRKASLLFAKALPHHLLSWEKSNGTRYTLRKVERIPYWSMNGPSGAEWWPADLRR